MIIPSTPFSGLSLLVHLAIISCAKVGSAFKKKNLNRLVPTKKSSPTPLRLKMDHIMSIAVIIITTSIMIFSFSIALRTGIREGRKEIHMQYLQQGYRNFREIKYAGAFSNGSIYYESTQK